MVRAAAVTAATHAGSETAVASRVAGSVTHTRRQRWGPGRGGGWARLE